MVKKINGGFTFIELLVVITIIILFTGISLAYYNNFSSQNALKSEANKMIDVFEFAKKNSSSALSNNASPTPTPFCSSGFTGYRIDVAANSYTLSVCCSASCPLVPAIQTYNLPTNISVYSGTGYIQFKQLTGGVSSNIAWPIKLKNSSLSSSANCLGISESSTIGAFVADTTFSSCP